VEFQQFIEAGSKQAVCVWNRGQAIDFLPSFIVG